MIEQPDKSNSIQSFMAQCVEQKVKYKKKEIPKRIEEALEELRLVPQKLEQKAPIPEVKMKIVKEVEHHKEGDGEEVDTVEIGTPLRVEWNLQPESGMCENFFRKVGPLFKLVPFRRVWFSCKELYYCRHS
jgi:hypothetical protein